MTRSDERALEDRILATVVEILEDDGYDAVQLREVARRSRASMTTIYKRYANRDELIAAAVQAWMDLHRFSRLLEQRPESGASLYNRLMGLLRTIFEPWEDHPAMLTAYFRARAAPGGQRIVGHGLDMAIPAFFDALGDVDETFIADLDTILSSLVYGLLGRFTAGEIDITDILPILDRAVFVLSSGYEAQREHSGATAGDRGGFKRSRGSSPTAARKASPAKRR